MIAQAADASLTLLQFIGLVTLNLAIIGLIIAQMRRASERDEEVKIRLTKLETELKYHLENGLRHDRKEN